MFIIKLICYYKSSSLIINYIEFIILVLIISLFFIIIVGNSNRFENLENSAVPKIIWSFWDNSDNVPEFIKKYSDNFNNITNLYNIIVNPLRNNLGNSTRTFNIPIIKNEWTNLYYFNYW